jgi:hypothetical protein
VEKTKGRDFIDLTLGTKDFVRTLSYRDIFTSISLALLLLAIREIIDYYSLDDWINAKSNLLMGIVTLVIIAFNHILYKIEHKRSNNFIGRVLHDCMFLLCYATIGKLEQLLTGSGFTITFEDIGSFFSTGIFLLVFLVGYEVVIAFFKRVLKLFRWRIL